MSHIGESLQIHIRNPSKHKSWWLRLASYFSCVGLSVLELTWHEWFFHQLPSQLCVCVCVLSNTSSHTYASTAKYFPTLRLESAVCQSSAGFCLFFAFYVFNLYFIGSALLLSHLQPLRSVLCFLSWDREKESKRKKETNQSWHCCFACNLRASQ